MNIIDLYREHINPDADAVDIFNLFNRFNIGPGYAYSDDVDGKIFKYLQEQNRERCIKWIIDNSVKNRAKNYMKLKDGYKERYTEQEVIDLLEYVRENFYDTGSRWHSEPDIDLTSEELLNEYRKK
jgi:hypothetical protein